MIRLQAYQKSKSRLIWDYDMSLARAGQGFSLHTHSNACPSRSPSMFCNNRTSLPHSPFMHAKHNGMRAAREHESPLHAQPKPVISKAPDIKEKSLEPDADYIPLELDDLDDYKSDSDAHHSTLLGNASVRSALGSSISYEDQASIPLNGKHNDDDRLHSHALNRRIISECETGQNSVIAHTMKDSKPSLQTKGCKRKATIQLDKLSDILSPRRGCSVAKKVSFSFGGNEISVTSDKSLHRCALPEDRGAVVEKGKQDVGFSAQDIQSKERDLSARSNLMSLSFAE